MPDKNTQTIVFKKGVLDKMIRRQLFPESEGEEAAAQVKGGRNRPGLFNVKLENNH